MLYKKVIYDRVVSFIYKHDVLYKYLYGFRANRSTNLAIMELVDQITSSIDNREACAVIFLDLFKAFDTEKLNTPFLKPGKNV